ncbi:LamG domain-containing protein [Candidatus Woesearchaeota archaeon]|nr:LamG domain-containing protein [Candidatus Woesearchaeota archaeon]
MKITKKTGKRAAVYTLDALLAILISTVIIMSVNGYFSRGIYNEILIAQPNEVAADLFSVMQKTDILEEYYLDNQHFFNGSIADKKGVNHCLLRNDARFSTITDDYYNFWLDLDGDDYVDCGDVMNMSTSDFSISFWFKTGMSSSNGWIISKYGVGPDFYGYGIYVGNTGRIVGYIKDGATGGTITTSSSYNDNAWTHAALVFDRDGLLSIYINGVNTDSGDISARANSLDSNSRFLIGNVDDGSGEYFNGSLDDIRIFSRVLTADEVSDIYNNISTATYDLISRYDLDVDYDTINKTIDDYLPNQYDMIIRLYNGNGTIISSRPLPEMSTVTDFIATGERMIAINRSGNIEDIVKARYYAWTK